MSSRDGATAGAIDPEFFAETQAEPYETYKALREQGPVYLDPLTGAYIVSRYEDVACVFRDDETFLARAHRMGALVAANRAGVELGVPRRTALGHDDGPYHDFLRGLIGKTYSALRIQKLEPVLQGIVDELLAGLAVETIVDVVPLLTEPLPVRAIAYLLGVGRDDYARFKAWGDGFLSTDHEVHAAATAEFTAHFNGAIEARRATPQDDIITHLVEARTADGEPLSDDEIVALLFHQVVAGSETTTNLLGSMLRLLSLRADLWSLLRSDRSLVRSFIEEVLRFESPVQWMMRTAARDAEIAGCPIPKGSTISPVIAAANRDAAAFADPDDFVLDRRRPRHLAFGLGTHSCLGAPLARQEARVSLETLLDRFSGVEPAGEPVISTVFLGTRGFASLPLRFLR